jgi:hypothetical protein
LGILAGSLVSLVGEIEVQCCGLAGCNGLGANGTECQSQIATRFAGSCTVEPSGDTKGNKGQSNGDQNDNDDQFKKRKAALLRPTLYAWLDRTA